MHDRPRIQGLVRNSRPYLLGLGLALLGIAASAGIATAGGSPAFLAFETEALDLDTGTTVERDPARGVGSSTQGVDMYVAYHAGWSPAAVVMPLPGAVTLVLHDTDYAAVSASDIDTATFSERPDDVPFEPGNTVLVRTGAGAVYKMGNVRESDTGATFEYARLQ